MILISHDRELIENVVTRSMIFQGDGTFIDVAGSYTDFERERASSKTLKPVFEQSRDLSQHLKSASNTPAKPVEAVAKPKPAKLSYKDQRELESLPEAISELEASIASIHSAMNSSSFYDDKHKADKSIKNAETLQTQLDKAYVRWEELEAMTH